MILHYRFDSILVRLKVQRFGGSHPVIVCFDSILVRLKAKKSGLLRVVLMGFDSILVRLKDSPRDSNVVDADAFRFHTGSIKRKSNQQQLHPVYHCFDSILVRLKELTSRIDLSQPM